MESAMLWLGMAGVGLGVLGVAFYVRELVMLLRAERDLVRVLAERQEYRPLLQDLLRRQREHGGRLAVTEHEAIDLRERIQQALVHLAPAERRQIEEGLYQYSAPGREFYLLKVLSASMRRLQHQS